MFSTPSRAPPSAAPALNAPPTHADPLVALWFEAVATYESETHLKLSRPTASSPSTLDSADAIFNFVNDHEAAFKAFRKDGALHLSGRLRHIVSVVGTLSSSIGEGVGVPFAPGKAIFAAIGELVKAALAVRDDFDAIYAAFDTMEQQLRIIQPAVGEDINSSLREPSVKLLAQILRVLGVITKLQQDGRFRTWLKKLAQSKTVSAALDDLRRLATNHHQTVSAVTLATAQKTLAILMDGVNEGAQDQDINRRCLVSIAQLAQEVYDELLRGSSVTSKGIQDMRASLEDIHSMLLNHVDGRKRSTGMTDICSWLHYQDCSPRLNDLLHHRVPSTGTWFLDGEDFAAFKSGSKRALWLQGKAGCGKSTLIAGAFQDLRAYCFSQDPQPLVLHHFFDATNGSYHQNLRALFASLLCQLAQFSNESLSVLSEIREDHMSGNSQPSLNTLQNQLSGLLDNLPGPVFVVVDALDEAGDADVIKLLEHLSTRHDARLLLSSRGEVLFYNRLHDLCNGTIVIRDTLVKGDISTVVQGAFNQGGDLERIREVDLVREALESGADGSFRWTILQIKALSPISGIPTIVRQKLKTLPKTLSETYEQCLQAIDPSNRENVRRLLTWVLLACDPPSIVDFTLLLSFDYTEHLPVFDASLRPSPIDTLALVGSTFITVLEYEVRFAHASVKEYLLALAPDSYFHVDAGLAYACMARTGMSYVSVPRSLHDYSDLFTSWVHYAGSNHHKALARELPAGFASILLPRFPGLFTSWARYVNMAGSNHYKELARDIAMTLGIRSNPSRLVSAHAENILCHALRFAARIGDAQLVEILQDMKGSDIDAAQHGESTLQIAVSENHLEVAVALLARGATINARASYGRSPLHVAAQKGHYEAADLLLRSGAEVNAVTQFSSGNYTPLHLAIKSGHLRVAELLIARGAKSNATGTSPLHLAAQIGHKEAAELLLQSGAHVNASDDFGRTALHCACEHDYREIADLLVARGADVNAGDNKGWTPLHMAAKQGRNTVQLLLGSGADIEARESTRGSTSLHIASESAYAHCIRALLERGADMESRDDRGWTPLTYAVRNSEEQAVRTLLDLGADPTVHTDHGTGLLDARVRCQDAETEERIRAMLLQAGARESAPQVVVPTVQDEGGGESEGDQSEEDPSEGYSSEGYSSGGYSSEGYSSEGRRAKRRRLE